jgi:hypothetical protein
MRISQEPAATWVQSTLSPSFPKIHCNIVMDLINALPGNNSVNTVQHRVRGDVTTVDSDNVAGESNQYHANLFL